MCNTHQETVVLIYIACTYVILLPSCPFRHTPQQEDDSGCFTLFDKGNTNKMVLRMYVDQSSVGASHHRSRSKYVSPLICKGWFKS